MIILHRSNRMERLVGGLAELLSTPAQGVDPLCPEPIVVQSRGMERFVAMQLSRRLGVWANPAFPFPRAVIEQALRAVLGPDAAADAYGRDAMSWAIAAGLPGRMHEPAFAPIAHYLRSDDGHDLLLQLSSRLAQLFDDYLVYRYQPGDFVAQWEQGAEPDDFQAVLLRDLAARLGPAHVAARARALSDALRAQQGPIDGFPQRLCLFGIASLPPLYLHVFEALSERVEVHLFMLSPSQEYWADIRRAGKAAPSAADAGADEHFDEGHPLLASLGLVAQDFHRLLEDGVGYLDGVHGGYVEPGHDSLLRALQSDILHLRHRGASDGPAPLPVAEDDHSVIVHGCHGPMREVEVLHDQLVSLLQDPGLQPHDIVVMAPDIEAYAPLVEAVFGETAGRPELPYRIADRRVRRTHALVDAFDAILEVLAGRITAGEVLDLLGRAPVRQRFEIPDEALSQLRSWVAESGIHWGVDADHRAEVGQPKLMDHTFRFGLDRLLLGFAMPGGDGRLFEGRLPLEGLEGGDAEWLGRLSHFCQTLFDCRRTLQGQHDMDHWRELLLAVMERTLSSEGELAEQQQAVREALLTLCQAAGDAGFDAPLSLRAVRRRLSAEIEEHAVARGFLAGGVTFCQLVPMRSIPFRVVCLLGMNDEDFPRRRPRLGFDRIASAKPRRGDRNPPAEDRYLFLEALLSARDRLIITYQSRGIHDNAVKPPSVLVGELLSVLSRGFTFPGQPAGDALSAERHLLVQHRLQPFSPHYFGAGDDPRLFSYARQFFEGATHLQGQRAPSVFIRAPLPPPPEPLGAVSLDALSRFIERPVRRFMQHRLGLYLEETHVVLDPREPAKLDPLQRWQVGDALLSAMRAGGSSEQAAAAVRASGALPPGTPGELALEGVVPVAQALVAAERARTGGQPPRPPLPFELSFDLAGGRVTLHGALRGSHAGLQLRTQFSRVGGRQELRMWLQHLVANALLQGGKAPDCPPHSLLIGRATSADEKRGQRVAQVALSPVDDAGSLLRGLVELYVIGQRFPLPFAYTAALPFVRALRQGKDEAEAFEAARAGFEGEYGEAKARDVALVYPDLDALLSARDPARFDALADRVLSPMLDHREAQ